MTDLTFTPHTGGDTGAKPYFTAGETLTVGVNAVEARVNDWDGGKSLAVTTKVINASNNEGATLRVNLDLAPKSQTKSDMTAGFLKAMYGTTDLSTVDLGTGVGKRVSLVALPEGNHNGKRYQHFANILNADGDIPF